MSTLVGVESERYDSAMGGRLHERAYSVNAKIKGLSARDIGLRVSSGFSLIDGLTITFFTYLLLNLCLAPDSVHANRAIYGLSTLLTLYVAVLVVVRGQILSQPRLRGVLYRATLFIVYCAAFVLFFRDALTGLQPDLWDADLANVDRALFGAVPAIWAAQFNSFWVTEYLAFFYLSHFLVVLYAVLPTLVTGRRDKDGISMTTGSLILIVSGWFIYTLVPGMGPYQQMYFSEPLNGGFFFKATMGAVESSGPLFDVFPSLHAGFTFFVALQVMSRGRDRYALLKSSLLLFVDANIILATIYLRFHYAVDVIAGLILATVVHRLSLSYSARLFDTGRPPRAQPVFSDPL